MNEQRRQDMEKRTTEDRERERRSSDRERRDGENKRDGDERRRSYDESRFERVEPRHRHSAESRERRHQQQEVKEAKEAKERWAGERAGLYADRTRRFTLGEADARSSMRKLDEKIDAASLVITEPGIATSGNVRTRSPRRVAPPAREGTPAEQMAESARASSKQKSPRKATPSPPKRKSPRKAPPSPSKMEPASKRAMGQGGTWRATGMESGMMGGEVAAGTTTAAEAATNEFMRGLEWSGPTQGPGMQKWREAGERLRKDELESIQREEGRENARRELLRQATAADLEGWATEVRMELQARREYMEMTAVRAGVAVPGVTPMRELMEQQDQWAAMIAPMVQRAEQAARDGADWEGMRQAAAGAGFTAFNQFDVGATARSPASSSSASASSSSPLGSTARATASASSAPSLAAAGLASTPSVGVASSRQREMTAVTTGQEQQGISTAPRRASVHDSKVTLSAERPRSQMTLTASTVTDLASAGGASGGATMLFSVMRTAAGGSAGHAASPGAASSVVCGEDCTMSSPGCPGFEFAGDTGGEMEVQFEMSPSSGAMHESPPRAAQAVLAATPRRSPRLHETPLGSAGSGESVKGGSDGSARRSLATVLGKGAVSAAVGDRGASSTTTSTSGARTIPRADEAGDSAGGSGATTTGKGQSSSLDAMKMALNDKFGGVAELLKPQAPSILRGKDKGDTFAKGMRASLKVYREALTAEGMGKARTEPLGPSLQIPAYGRSAAKMPEAFRPSRMALQSVRDLTNHVRAYAESTTVGTDVATTAAMQEYYDYTSRPNRPGAVADLVSAVVGFIRPMVEQEAALAQQQAKAKEVAAAAGTAPRRAHSAKVQDVESDESASESVGGDEDEGDDVTQRRRDRETADDMVEGEGEKGSTSEVEGAEVEDVLMEAEESDSGDEGKEKSEPTPCALFVAVKGGVEMVMATKPLTTAIWSKLRDGATQRGKQRGGSMEMLVNELLRFGGNTDVDRTVLGVEVQPQATSWQKDARGKGGLQKRFVTTGAELAARLAKPASDTVHGADVVLILVSRAWPGMKPAMEGKGSTGQESALEPAGRPLPTIAAISGSGGGSAQGGGGNAKERKQSKGRGSKAGASDRGEGGSDDVAMADAGETGSLSSTPGAGAGAATKTGKGKEASVDGAAGTGDGKIIECPRCSGLFVAKDKHRTGSNACNEWMVTKRGSGAGAKGQGASGTRPQSGIQQRLLLEELAKHVSVPPQTEGWQQRLSSGAPRTALSVAGAVFLGPEGCKEWAERRGGAESEPFVKVESLAGLQEWQQRLKHPLPFDRKGPSAGAGKAAGKGKGGEPEKAFMTHGKEYMWFGAAIAPEFGGKGQESEQIVYVAVHPPSKDPSKGTAARKAKGGDTPGVEGDVAMVRVAVAMAGEGGAQLYAVTRFGAPDQTTKKLHLMPTARLLADEELSVRPETSRLPTLMPRGFVSTERPKKGGGEVSQATKRAVQMGGDGVATPRQLDMEVAVMQHVVRRVGVHMTEDVDDDDYETNGTCRLPFLDLSAARGDRARKYEGMGLRPVVRLDKMIQDARHEVVQCDVMGEGFDWVKTARQLGKAAVVHVNETQPALSKFITAAVENAGPAILSFEAPMDFVMDQVEWAEPYKVLWTRQLGRQASAVADAGWTFAPGTKWVVCAPEWLVQGLVSDSAATPGGWATARKWARDNNIELQEFDGEEMEWADGHGMSSGEESGSDAEAGKAAPARRDRV